MSLRVLLLLLSGLSLGISVHAADLSEQRQNYRAAEQALAQNQVEKYQKLASTLRNYPLYPYLQFEELKKNLNNVSASEVSAFTNRYADTPLAARLYDAWLGQLASSGRWQDFSRFYQGQNSIEMQCHYLEALHRTGETIRSLQSVSQLWLSGKSQPAACDYIFAQWQQAGNLTGKLAWQRFRLAMNEGNIRLANTLLSSLDADYRAWGELWLAIRDKPETITTSSALAADTPVTRELISFGIKRMGRFSATKAWDLWQTSKNQYSFSPSELMDVDKRLAMNRIIQRDPPEKNLLDPLVINAKDSELQEWRIRMALRSEDWGELLAWLDRLPTDQQSLPAWKYWRVRALEATNSDKATVNRLYTELSKDRSYYGFMAADKIQAKYAIQHASFTVSANTLSNLEDQAGIQRAKELFLLGKLPDARREWQYITKNMDTVQLVHAAKLAKDWGWHDRALSTLERTPYTDALDYAYPITHEDHVSSESRVQSIDPAWAYAVIRQESTFTPDARSPVGAMGLMQIMPETGQELARLFKAPLQNINNLLDEKTNISFGIRYLRMTLNRFKENIALATAAYNAGGTRVQQWLPDNRVQDVDIWIDTIPFKETRNYVKKVMANTVIYDYRLGRTPTALNKRILPVNGVKTEAR